MWDLELFTSFILSQLLLASQSQLFNPEFLNFRLWLYILGAKKKNNYQRFFFFATSMLLLGTVRGKKVQLSLRQSMC